MLSSDLKESGLRRIPAVTFGGGGGTGLGVGSLEFRMNGKKICRWGPGLFWFNMVFSSLLYLIFLADVSISYRTL